MAPRPLSELQGRSPRMTPPLQEDDPWFGATQQVPPPAQPEFSGAKALKPVHPRPVPALHAMELPLVSRLQCQHLAVACN